MILTLIVFFGVLIGTTVAIFFVRRNRRVAISEDELDQQLERLHRHECTVTSEEEARHSANLKAIFSGATLTSAPRPPETAQAEYLTARSSVKLESVIFMEKFAHTFGATTSRVLRIWIASISHVSARQRRFIAASGAALATLTLITYISGTTPWPEKGGAGSQLPQAGVQLTLPAPVPMTCETCAGSRVSIRLSPLFLADRPDLTSKGRELVLAAANVIEHNDHVVIEGHAARIGKAESAYKLSLQRAQAVADLLIDLGVPKSQLMIVGRGFEHPLTVSGLGVEERRVDIYITRH
ncbi:OmpA family protein [Amycolatopsis sp. NPDC003861]